MDKFCTFFERSKLLDTNDFNELAKYAKFDVKLLNDDSKIKLIILPQNVIPIDILSKLLLNAKEIEKNLILEFSGNLLTIDQTNFYGYLKYFLTSNHINDFLINDLIQEKGFDVNNDKIIVNYFSNSQYLAIKRIKPTLLDFFKSLLINLSDLEFKFDEEYKNLSANLKVKEDEIKESIHKRMAQESTTNPIKAHNKSAINKQEKKLKPENRLMDFKDISNEDGQNQYATVQGEIFKVEINNSRNTCYIYYLTNYDDTFVIKAYPSMGKSNNMFWLPERKLPSEYLDTFKKGDWVKVYINIKEKKDNSSEFEGIVSYIYKIKTPEKFIRTDDVKPRRIELLAHTNMSTHDGLISPEDLIKRTLDIFHWQAIGVADRYNVHAYPDLMIEFNKLKKEHAKKQKELKEKLGSNKLSNEEKEKVKVEEENVAIEQKQKIIYGVELNVINDHIEIVSNPINQDLETGEYVIFDIETTGLNNEFDEITEFGAIKVKNGIIVDSVDWFISTNKPIPLKIKEKTHITDEMLKGQPTIKESLKKILDFFGNSVLIAHNALNFDVRFINKKLQQNNMPILTNTIIDTLQLSYVVNEHLNRHNLGVISHDYKINYDDAIAHRADFDARALYQVWSIMLNKLHQKNIHNIIDINKILQNEFLHKNQFGYNLLVYAKNQEGIKSIYKLISSSHTVHLHKRPRVYLSELKKLNQDLIIVNHPSSGDVWDLAINGTDDQLIMALKNYDYIFVCPPTCFSHLENRGDLSNLNIKKTISKIINASKNVNKKVIAVSDAFYLDEWDETSYAVYVHAKQVGGGNHRYFRYGDDNSILPDLHLRTTKEMLDEFEFLKEQDIINDIVINNTYEFSDSIKDNIKPLKEGSFRPKMGDVDNNLKKVIYDNAKKIYGDNIPKEINDRIDHELSIIIDLKYAVIYWICYLLVKKANEDGQIVGSRGSVGSSIVAYLTNISEVNPLAPHYLCPKCKHLIWINDEQYEDGFDLPEHNCPVCNTKMKGDGHNIPFETFLGFKGDPKVPDIDLNFSGEYQSTAHNFIKEMFGEKQTFRAGTIGTVAEKTAYGLVKNYFELTQPEAKIKDSTIKLIANKCVDVKRTTGQHPGGIVIVPKEYDILDFTPYQYPADDKTANFYTTHFNFEKIHDNLLKFDILGHENPTVLRALEKITGIDSNTIPFHDDKVLKLYTSLDSLKLPNNFLMINGKQYQKTASLGLPEFGTEFIQQMLIDAQPKSFADLIHISGLSHGTDVWIGNAKDLIVKEHMSLKQIITCRDDIMLYLIQKGMDRITAFRISETVRKGKKLSEELVNEMKKCNIPEWYINSCNKIKYLFPKAHAAAYVIMSWKIAWFKMYYPLAFYATYFSIRCDVLDIVTMIKGVEALKIKIADIRNRDSNILTKHTVTKKEKDLIPIYELALEMYGRGYSFQTINLTKSDATQFIIEGNTLIPPFKALDTLGEIAAQSIVDARKEKFFTSKEDLLQRTKITKTNLIQMNDLGTTKDLDEDNQMTLF